MNIFSKLPEDVKYKIMTYVIITNSAKALKTCIGWYINFVKFHNNQEISFKDFYFTKLKRLDKDLILSLINYKISRKNRYYYR